jgi:hypothetical protein
MSLSNYPAGVTGNEAQIAGYDSEQDAYRECGRAGTLPVFTLDAAREIERIKALLAEIAEGKKPASLAATLVVNLDYLMRHRINHVDVDACPFAEEVSIGWYGKTGTWQCPLCQSEHLEEAEEQDPDHAWDSRFDD